ncbi:hypothetical protein [Jatrophihabitans sp.]|uniref:hypothetical protein n=1 Tax=Jatrophihabitans sp. TaxID=1932789 RepID=UPI0030C69B90|nr:hypothetical protein [Jatrophihabitans sp.]
MVEEADGQRTLLAPSGEIADFIGATYSFDTVRIEPVVVAVAGHGFTLSTPTLQLEVAVGRRTSIGWLLSAVPGRLARSPRWCRLIGPLARLLRPGVRTVGTAGGGRTEYYCATDERAVSRVHAELDGLDLGALRPVRPPVRFGFASAPARPSSVRVTTLIELP